MDSSRKIAAEFLGTFWLVLGGCGAAVLACNVPSGIGYLGVALAFGLTVVTGAYAFGHISGGHFNPAVSFGLFTAGRMKAMDMIVYWIAQVLGGIAGAAVLYVIARGVGTGTFDPTGGGFASNGYGEHSPMQYTLMAAAVCEVVMTFMFLVVILNTTSAASTPGFAALAIGLTLVLIHLISIPVTNTSVNPARSTAVAIFQGGWALEQLWLFWVAPLVGGGLAGIVQRWLAPK